MSNLPLDLSAALSAFTYPYPIRVTETLGKRVEGRYQIEELPERSITGVVLVIDTERLEFLSGGDATVGGINISTRDPLYFTDPKDGGTENRQSYVHYQGYRFRVVASRFTLGNTVYNSYDCLRYMDAKDAVVDVYAVPVEPNAITPNQVEDVFARVLRENIYDGEDLALIEPYNGPRPQSAYATVHLIIAEPEQNEVYGFDDRPEGFTETMRGTSWCRATLRFYGEGAFTTATRAKNVLNSNNRLFDVIRAIGYGNIGAVKDDSSPYQGRIEERAYLNVDFYANFAAEFLSNYFRRVKGTIKRDGEDDVPYKVLGPR